MILARCNACGIVEILSLDDLPEDSALRCSRCALPCFNWHEMMVDEFDRPEVPETES